MLALYFGRLKHLSFENGRQVIEALRTLPHAVQTALGSVSKLREVAMKYHKADNFLYLRRQFNFPTALERALKLKEISYIHAEGYPAVEMKHGPIALVENATPSVFIVPHGATYDKVMANMEGIKARGGPINAIASHNTPQVNKITADVIRIPKAPAFLQPMVTVVPLHLLSYHIALLQGWYVDRPRNLAKSVTVE